jgi:hypothetical protein
MTFIQLAKVRNSYFMPFAINNQAADWRQIDYLNFNHLLHRPTAKPCVIYLSMLPERQRLLL